MGYETDFELTVDRDYDLVDQYLKTDSIGYLGYLEGYGHDWYLHGKWYDHEQDMKVLSTQFPTVLFTLEGDGEDKGDLWIKYFKNGKVQIAEAQITYEPFNEEKLR